MPPEMTSEATGAALYAYAVLPAGAAPPAEAAPLLPGAAPALVPAGAVAALVSPVPRAAFEAGPDCRMADPDWVAARAAAHHAVVVAAAAAGPALPLAFGAVFSGPEPLRDWLAAREAALGAALDAVLGCEEWSVTLAEDPERHEAWLGEADPALRDLSARIAGAAAGTAFLLERRRDRAARAARAARRGAVGGAVAGILGRHARSVSAAEPGWTALVPRDTAAALRAALEATAREIAGTGLSLGLSGPWPPYAFAREAVRHG